MLLIKYLALCFIVCTHCTNSKENNRQSIKTIRRKRAISQVSEKTFKKAKVSTASFTKDGSTRLDTKTWPKLVPIMLCLYQSYIYR